MGIEPIPPRSQRGVHASTPRPPRGFPELESNQHHRLQRPAHDLRSGNVVGAEGIEPPSAVCRTTALPLDEAPVGAAGVEPAPSCSRNRRLPIKPSRREIDSGRTTHPWFDAGRCVGVEVVPTPATFRVSLQPGDESLRARAADRHVGTVIVPRRRVERATATETAFGIFHGVLLSFFREPPGNRTPFARVRTGCFASKAWDSCRACRRMESNQLRPA